jgi:trigger factor
MSEVKAAAKSGVKVETEPLSGSRVAVAIEVPAAQVDAAFDRTLQRLGQRVKIQGFRPGKAPRALIEARIGAAGLRDEVAEQLVPAVVSQALLEHEIEPIDRPQVDIETLERGEPGRFRARVSVMPKVTLPDLSTLHVEPRHTEITDADVEQEVISRLDSRSEVQPVEREVQVGDVVVGDLRAFVGGEEIPSEARQAIELEVREGVLVPELLAALPGHSVGEVVPVEVEMPETHSNPALRGQRTTLEVTVQGVKEKHVPELTDELAKEVSDGAQETADAFRAAIHDELMEEAKRADEVDDERRALQALVDAAQVEVPDALVDHEVEHRIEQVQERLRGSGMQLDRYFEYLGRTEAAYRAELRPEAKDSIKVDLVLEQAERELGEDPTDEEVRDYIRAQAEQEPSLKEDLDRFLAQEGSLELFRRRLRRVRIVSAVRERLTGEKAADADVQRLEVEVEPAPPATAAGPGDGGQSSDQRETGEGAEDGEVD